MQITGIAVAIEKIWKIWWK